MEFKFNIINFIVFLVLLIWALMLIFAPYGADEDCVHFGNDGVTGLTEHADEIDENIDNEFVRSIYDSGDSMCHQRSSRSLFINGNQMPYCARCTGIFLGFAIGVAILAFIRIDIRWFLPMLILGFAPMGVDWLLQSFFSFYHSNMTRLITGGLAGVITGFFIGFIVLELSEVAKYELERRKHLKAQQEEETAKEERNRAPGVRKRPKKEK